MKTSELPSICPYTGLRSFTEEESLYFKVVIIGLTDHCFTGQNKFLMVTDASGEGKSSLIYAGLIPNAGRLLQSTLYQLGGCWFQTGAQPCEKNRRSRWQRWPIGTAVEQSLGVDFLHWLIYIPMQNSRPTIRQRGPVARYGHAIKNARLPTWCWSWISLKIFTNPENYYNEAPSQDSDWRNLSLKQTHCHQAKLAGVHCLHDALRLHRAMFGLPGLPEYIGFHNSLFGLKRRP